MMRASLFVPLLLVAGATNSRGALAQDQQPPPVLEDRPEPSADVEDRPESPGIAYLGVGFSRQDLDLKIFEVVPGSPAELAGLKVGDIILAVDGGRVLDALDFVRKIGAKNPREKLKVVVLREEEPLSVEVTLGSRSATPPGVEPPPVEPPPVEPPPVEPPGRRTSRAFLGVGYGEVPVPLAVHLRLDPGVGILVADVRPGSAAEKAGIVTHDVIVRIDGEPVKGRRGLVDLVGRRRPGDEVTIEIIHRGEPATKKVVLAERPNILPPLRFDDPLRSAPPLWPRGSWRGRLRIGDEFNYEIPWGELDGWREELPSDLKDWLEDGGFDDSVRNHLEEAFKDFELRSHSRTQSSAQSSVRLIEGDLDVTVTSVDGDTRVTVRKGGETIANDLPYEKLESLPAEVRDVVRELIGKHEIELIEPFDPGVRELEPRGRVKI